MSGERKRTHAPPRQTCATGRTAGVRRHCQTQRCIRSAASGKGAGARTLGTSAQHAACRRSVASSGLASRSTRPPHRPRRGVGGCLIGSTGQNTARRAKRGCGPFSHFYVFSARAAATSHPNLAKPIMLSTGSSRVIRRDLRKVLISTVNQQPPVALSPPRGPSACVCSPTPAP